MRIQIHGYYGEGNVGDELILSSLIDRIRKTIDAAEIAVETEDPTFTSKIHFVEQTVPRFNPLQPSLSWFRQVRRADELWIGGGGIFSTGGMLKYAMMVFLATLFGVRVVLVSVGFANPLQRWHEKMLLRFSLPLVDCITVRNERSISNIRATGYTGQLHTVPDPAFALDASRLQPAENGTVQSNSLLVVPRETWDRSLDKSAFAAALDEAAVRSKCEVIFLPFSSNSNPPDVDVAYEVADRMEVDSDIIDRDITPREAVNIIRQARVVVGIRLHSIIIAATEHIPFVGLAYRPKCEETLHQLGIQDVMWVDQIDEEALTDEIVRRWQQGERREVRHSIGRLSEESRGIVQVLSGRHCLQSRIWMHPLFILISISVPIELIFRFID